MTPGERARRIEIVRARITLMIDAADQLQAELAELTGEARITRRRLHLVK